jgi:hypothetical protein
LAFTIADQSEVNSWVLEGKPEKTNDILGVDEVQCKNNFYYLGYFSSGDIDGDGFTDPFSFTGVSRYVYNTSLSKSAFDYDTCSFFGSSVKYDTRDRDQIVNFYSQFGIRRSFRFDLDGDNKDETLFENSTQTASGLIWRTIIIYGSECLGYSDFRRGDANADSKVDIADPIFVVYFKFLDGATPTCLKAADADDSGTIDVTDGIFLIQYLFQLGSHPPMPFPACGADPTPDAISCETQWTCP